MLINKIDVKNYIKNYCKNYAKNSYIIYTFSFLLLSLLIFYPFIENRITFIWKLDGLCQHFTALQYYGKWLREIVSGKGLSMIDFQIGLGFDTLTTLHYYAIGDPLTLLTVFMTEKNAIFIYNLLIMIRFYLSGISFILLMKYFKKNGTGVALGALLYVFSGYSLYAGIKHPFFLNPMIYLPLLIIGAEQALRRKKPYFMIFIVFISAISNFYFFYVLTVIIVIYVIFRYVTLYKKDYQNVISGFFLTGLQCGSYYLIGTALASTILVPTLYAFSQNGRLHITPQMVEGYFHYGIQYYLSFFAGFFVPGTSPGYWTKVSFPCVAFVSLILLFSSKKYGKCKMLYLLIVAGLFIPAFGYFMNGFSYTSNRWCFLLSLLVAITFTYTYEDIFRLKKNAIVILVIGMVLYGIAYFIYEKSLLTTSILIVFLIIMAGVFLIQLKWFKENPIVSHIILYVLVIVSLAANGYGFYAKQYNDYAEEFLSYKEVKRVSSEGFLPLIRDIKDNSFYRIDTHGDEELNDSLTIDYHNVSAYYSLMDGEITSYCKDLEILNQKSAYRFDNLDSRTALDTLAGVKYFITTKHSAIPYGYVFSKEIALHSHQYYLYRNIYALPIIYTYNNYISQKDYNSLHALDKQNAMLQAVVLNQDTDYADKMDINTLSQTESIPVEIKPDTNVMVTDHKIVVKKAGASITLQFKASPNSETYVRFGKLHYLDKENFNTSFYIKGILDVKKWISVKNQYNSSYFGKENYLVNLGYSQDGVSSAVITFPKKGTFQYDSISVYSMDMNHYAEQVNALQESTVSNTKQVMNGIQSDIDMKSKGIALLSIPYSKGWSAYVDGDKQKILRANEMYMALQLTPGMHHIVLTYETPYLRIGMLFSLGALFVIILLCAADRKFHYYH